MTADLAVPPLSLLAAINAVARRRHDLLGTLERDVAASRRRRRSRSGCSWLRYCIAWWRFARDRVPFRLLLAVPGYVLTKLPLYATFLFRRERTWVRTHARLKRRRASSSDRRSARRVLRSLWTRSNKRFRPAHRIR